MDVIIQAIKELSTENIQICLLYTSDAADERSSVDLGGRRIIKKKKKKRHVGGRATRKIEARQHVDHKHNETKQSKSQSRQ